MDATEIAWAAGFFDGEGTAYASRNGSGRRYLILSVGNTEKEPLERFQRLLGGRIYRQRDKGNKLARKEFHVLKIARRGDVAAAVEALLPYLCGQKRAAIGKARALEAENLAAEGYGYRIWETRRARYGPTGRASAAVGE